MCQKTLQSLGMVLALGCVGFASSVFAGDYPCPPNRGPVTIDGNIVVRNGACTLTGTTVKGNVLVYSGGSLTTIGARIDGNIQAKDAVSVTVGNNTYVDGDIQLENLRGATSSSVTNSSVMGNIQLKSNRQSVTVEKNEVDGDIQLEGLRSTTEAPITHNKVKGNIQLKSNYLPLSVESNTVDGDVQAFSNRSNPLFISKNRIDGNLPVQGQCSGPDRRRQYRFGKQGRPVPPAIIAGT
jgi:hypothetical protein